MKRLIRAADLFCGAGGTSTGLRKACEVLGYDLQLLAINHWDVAIATHTANHPDAAHLCTSIDAVDPKSAIPGGRLDLLWASPECQHFSVARGGKPVSDQNRASAWLVLRWAELLYIDTILIENVKEFVTWGPVGVNGRPMKSKRGETFAAFVNALQSLGYRVEWKVLNAADYGAATTRERLFLQARRGRKPINWPSPSHSKSGGKTLFGKTRKWRPAREIIDWELSGKSIFGRKRPLSPATMARILAGLEKFNGKELAPFLVILRNHMNAQSVDAPIPTLTAGGNHVGVAQPFLTAFHGGPDAKGRNYSVDKPVGTIDTSNRFGLVRPEPFIVPQFSTGQPKTVDGPLGAITTTSRGMGLAVPFILPHRVFKKGHVDSISDPLRTITTVNGLQTTLVEPKPFIVGAGGSEYAGKPRHVDQPIATVVTQDHKALVNPFLLQVTHGGRVLDPSNPLPTVTGAHRGETGVVSPFLSKYYGSGEGVSPVTAPVPTVTTKDRFGLVTPLIIETADGNLMGLDILFRMLTPRELARAMSFPDDYKFTGNREAVVKQIGNAVDGSMARALCEAVMA